MGFTKSELEVLDDEFGIDGQKLLVVSDSEFDESDYENDPEFKAYQLDLLRQDPYMTHLGEIETERRRFPVEMIDIDLIG